jgi:type II secretory ATPase GspE/PulE/Tfp pilus assembly ATPase PilB-like protein
VILATGPAGSGRTHFLYACIEQVRREPLSVITLEEQPELSFSGVTQIVYAPDRGLDAASAFQAAMEQDTDVAMVAGVEGARWPDLYRAAQAGRLILAEGSQPDPIAMLRRLHECGVPAEQLRDLTLGIVTGRVVPRACGECLKPTSPRPEHLEALGIPEERAPEAVPLPAGCESCKGRGTVGLLCVRTFLVPDRELLEALAAGQSSAALRELAASRGLAVPLHGLFREQVQAGRVRIHDAIAALSDVH